jgi:hypothetical protein
MSLYSKMLSLMGLSDIWVDEPEEVKPTLIRIAELTDSTKAEKTGVYYVAGRRSATLTSVNVISGQFIGITLIAQKPGEHLYAIDLDKVDTEELASVALKSLGSIKLSYVQPVQILHTTPVFYHVVYMDVKVTCNRCKKTFSHMNLEYEGLDGVYVEDRRACPCCKEWDCCDILYETVAQYRERKWPGCDNLGNARST